MSDPELGSRYTKMSKFTFPPHVCSSSCIHYFGEYFYPDLVMHGRNRTVTSVPPTPHLMLILSPKHLCHMPFTPIISPLLHPLLPPEDPSLSPTPLPQE